MQHHSDLCLDLPLQYSQVDPVQKKFYWIKIHLFVAPRHMAHSVVLRLPAINEVNAM